MQLTSSRVCYKDNLLMMDLAKQLSSLCEISALCLRIPRMCIHLFVWNSVVQGNVWLRASRRLERMRWACDSRWHNRFSWSIQPFFLDVFQVSSLWSIEDGNATVKIVQINATISVGQRDYNQKARTNIAINRGPLSVRSSSERALQTGISSSQNLKKNVKWNKIHKRNKKQWKRVDYCL
jgi:hypothetical protein